MTETGQPGPPLEQTTKWGSNQEWYGNFLVCPVEMRNQLGVLLEIPSLSWLVTNGNHTQKGSPKSEMSSRDHKSSKTTQKDAQTMPNGHKSGYFMTQPSFPKWRKTGNNATSLLELPTNFSGMYTYQREPDEESTRSWTHRSRESDGTGGICFLPSDRYRNSLLF